MIKATRVRKIGPSSKHAKTRKIRWETQERSLERFRHSLKNGIDLNIRVTDSGDVKWIEELRITSNCGLL